MFWRKKKSTGPAVAGCFGKLPATGDFIRHNAGGDDLAAFDQWMGSGIDAAQRSLGAAYEGLYQRSVGLFIFHAEPKGDEAPGRALIGAWAASGDNAGRLYPMVVFASVDYDKAVQVGGGLPIATWKFLTAAYELATTGRTLTVAAFLERVARLEAPQLDDPKEASAAYRQWLSDNTMKAFWETGFGTDASRYWVMSNLAESVQPFVGQELPSTGLALRLPLGAGDAYATAVWIDMALRLSRWKGTLINTFWTPQQVALLHLGAPHPGSFRELLSATGKSEHIAELCGIPTCEEGVARARLAPQLASVVASTDQSIAEFLRSLEA